MIVDLLGTVHKVGRHLDEHIEMITTEGSKRAKLLVWFEKSASEAPLGAPTVSKDVFVHTDVLTTGDNYSA